MNALQDLFKDPIYITTLIIVIITIILGIGVFLYKLITKKQGPISSPCTIHLLLVSLLYSIIHLLDFNINRKYEDPFPAFSKTTCILQGFFSTWLSATREIWSLTILFSCYQLLIHKRNITENLNKFHLITIPFCYFIPSILPFSFLIMNYYEMNNLTCWIKTNIHINTFIFFFIKVLITLLLIILIIYIVYIFLTTSSKEIRSLNIKFQMESIQNQIIYPILQFIDSSISTIYIVILLIFHNNKNASIIKTYSIITMFISLIFNIIYLVIYVTSFQNQNIYVKDKDISTYLSKLSEEDINAPSIINVVKNNETGKKSNLFLTESYCD